MQFQRKLMNQPLENGRKLSFGPDFGLFWPKFGSQNFFCGFYLYYMLYIVVSYHCIQFQGKLMNKTGENGKKPSFWPDFDPFGPNSGCNFFYFFYFFFLPKICLRQSLYLMVSYRHVEYQKQLLIQYWKNLVKDRQTDGQRVRQMDRQKRVIS